MGLGKIGGESSRVRRGRRLGSITKRSCSGWLFSLAVLFLVYLSFFGRRLSFLETQNGKFNQDTSRWNMEKKWRDAQGLIIGNVSNGRDSYTASGQEGYQTEVDLSNNTFSSAEEVIAATTPLHPNKFGPDAPRHFKSKPRRRHGPCEVEFLKSVDGFVEPKDYMNFSQFSLEYIFKEQKPYVHNELEPRFGGHQTLEEREYSFYAKNQTLHCGFVKGPDGSLNTGFDLYENDKRYMSTCSVVVSSCIFGSHDFLRRPTGSKVSAYSKKNVCFVMFMDELSMAKLSSEGQVIDERGYIGLWRVVIVKNLPYTDMRKTGKVPKFLAHRLFPLARYSIWIDSKMRLQADPILILEYFLWRARSEYAISRHYDRRCVWEEVLQNKRLNKYNHTAIDEQFQFYLSDGLIKFNESDPNAPLPSYVPEGSFIVRAHTPMSNLFSCLWFNEVDRFTSRDQLSFAYTYLKLRRMNPEKPFFLNMFKDCERRALAKLFHHRSEMLPRPRVP